MKIFKEIKKTSKAAKEKMVTLILAGFGLVAALAWNDAVQTLFSVLFPKSEGVVGKFFYAVLVTILVVIATIQLKKIIED